MRVITTLEDPVFEKLQAAAAAERRSVSSYVAILIEREFEKREAADCVRSKAAAAAAHVGADKVLAVLDSLSADSYAEAATGGGK